MLSLLCHPSWHSAERRRRLERSTTREQPSICQAAQYLHEALCQLNVGLWASRGENAGQSVLGLPS
jgi:hypothetical protein